jgi:AcrR family transcriptional regulator
MRRRASNAAARGGRPSRADALRLRERILEAATELFLAEGYGSTSIEAIARRAGVSKRTLYDRFDDKPALFTAVVHRIIGQIRPPPNVPLVEGATLADILQRLALLILHAALAPQAIALHRALRAEAQRRKSRVRGRAIPLHGRGAAAAPCDGLRHADDAGGARGLGGQSGRAVPRRLPAPGRVSGRHFGRSRVTQPPGAETAA